MNKFIYILIAILFVTFLNQILTDFFFREALILDKKNNISAKEKFEACLKTNPGYLKAMLSMARIYTKTEGRGGIKKAFDILKKIESMDYYYPSVHYRIGQILCEWGKWDNAIEEFNIAIEQRKSDNEIYYDLGRVYYWGKKDYKKSELYFKQALKFRARHKDIKEYLRNIKKFMGK